MSSAAQTLLLSGLLVAALLAKHPADAAPLGGGPRKTIAVGGFESAASSPESGDGLSSMLTAALLKDPHLILVERQAMDQLRWEQKAGQNGATASGPKPGQMIGASVLVRGTVTKFDPHASGGAIDVGGLLDRRVAGSFGIGTTTAVVEITLRLIETATGRVIASSTAKGSAATNNLDASFYRSHGLSVGLSGFAQTPMGQACQHAIDQAVADIDAAMEQVPWSSSIVDNTGDQIYLAGGFDAGMQAGTTLHVYRKVRDLTDPSTGEVLETITAPVGTIEVKEVHDKVSIAASVDGGAPQRGDIVKLN